MHENPPIGGRKDEMICKGMMDKAKKMGLSSLDLTYWKEKHTWKTVIQWAASTSPVITSRRLAETNLDKMQNYTLNCCCSRILVSDLSGHFFSLQKSYTSILMLHNWLFVQLFRGNCWHSCSASRSAQTAKMQMQMYVFQNIPTHQEISFLTDNAEHTRRSVTVIAIPDDNSRIVICPPTARCQQEPF